MRGFQELGSLPDKQNVPLGGLWCLNLCPCGASLPREYDITLQQEITLSKYHFPWVDYPEGSLVSHRALLVTLWPRGLLGR